MEHGYDGTYDSKNFSSEIILYIPDDNYAPDVTYRYICGLDYELERMREFFFIIKTKN